MPLIKPKFDGQTSESNQYNGPPPVPGPYHGVVKKMWYATIKSGKNEGEGQYKILIEIDQGKFKGAGLFHNLQMLEQNAWSTNQFLDSMTAKEEQSKVLRKWFWEIGCDVETESDKVGQPVNFIGKPKFVPAGKELSFIIKNEPDNNGGTRAVIDRFIVSWRQEDEAEEDDGIDPVATEDDSDGMGEFDAATTSNPEADAPPPPDEDDGDDPWS